MSEFFSAYIYDLRVNDFVCPIGIDTNVPYFSWKMASSSIGAAQTAYRIIVKDVEGAEMWNSGFVEDDKSVAIPYRGTELSPITKYTVSVEIKDENGDVTAPVEACFETALLDKLDISDVFWISSSERDTKKGNLPAFRKEFKVQKGLKRARLFTSGLGVYDSYINGTRVGGENTYVLKPGYTEATITRYYNTFDVTDILNSSDNNVLSAIVCKSWWCDNGVFFKMGKKPAYFALLVLDYENGKRECIKTNTDWKTAKSAPVQADTSIYNAERYDATVSTDWMYNNFDESTWENAKVSNEFKGTPEGMSGGFVKIRDDLELAPESITVYKGAEGASDGFFGKIKVIRSYADGEDITLKRGETLLVDFGQNFAGFEDITVTSNRGTKIDMYHAEMLNDKNGAVSRGNDGPEGSAYKANYRDAETITKYITAGEKYENWHPFFSFSGFRYLEIKVSKTTVFHSLRGKVVTSVLEDTAEISTSDPDINKLISNVRWGMYSNYLSVPTDCPQRNERLGWLGDTQVFAKTGMFLGNNKKFLEKFARDVREGQMLDNNSEDYGAYPAIAPASAVLHAEGSFGWADCGIILPYYIYKMSGDVSVICDMWESMRIYMEEFLGVRKYGPKMIFGDWLAYEETGETGNKMMGVCFHALDALMMAEMAEAINLFEVAKEYKQVYAEKRSLFNEEFVNADGTLAEATQATCLYALYIDMVDDVKTVSNQLVENIERNGNKLQTGFLGTAILTSTLTKIGRTDVAYKLLLQRENPSWLYSVDQGATTIWERWNSYTLVDGFGDVSMNSFNHYAYGAVLGWMISDLAGIDYDEKIPGFKKITLSPKPDKSIPEIKAKFNSPYGEIVSNMSYEDENWIYNAKIPANTSATVKLLLQNTKNLSVNGKTVEDLTLKTDGIEFVRFENGIAVFDAVAGEFNFYLCD